MVFIFAICNVLFVYKQFEDIEHSFIIWGRFALIPLVCFAFLQLDFKSKWIYAGMAFFALLNSFVFSLGLDALFDIYITLNDNIAAYKVSIMVSLSIAYFLFNLALFFVILLERKTNTQIAQPHMARRKD